MDKELEIETTIRRNQPLAYYYSVCYNSHVCILTALEICIQLSVANQCVDLDWWCHGHVLAHWSSMAVCRAERKLCIMCRNKQKMEQGECCYQPCTENGHLITALRQKYKLATQTLWKLIEKLSS